MKFIRENQAIIYIAALMLITAGYLNYTSNNKEDETQETVANTTQVADIGDAALVNSNDVVAESAPVEVEASPTVDKNSATDVTTEGKSSDYFMNSKLERDKMYSQMIEVYQKVLSNNNSQEAQKQVATEEIQKINNIKNSIMICENLIKTKGFENSVIFVNGESINVIIGTKDLEKEMLTQIQNIIEREMEADSKNIHIAIN